MSNLGLGPAFQGPQPLALLRILESPGLGPQHRPGQAVAEQTAKGQLERTGCRELPGPVPEGAGGLGDGLRPRWVSVKVGGSTLGGRVTDREEAL